MRRPAQFLCLLALLLAGCSFSESDSNTETVGDASAEAVLADPEPTTSAHSAVEPEPDIADIEESESGEVGADSEVGGAVADPENSSSPEESVGESNQSEGAAATPSDVVDLIAAAANDERVTEPSSYIAAPLTVGCDLHDGIRTEPPGDAVVSISGPGMRSTICVTSGNIAMVSITDPDGVTHFEGLVTGLEFIRFDLSDPRGTYSYSIVDRKGVSEGSFELNLPDQLSIEPNRSVSEPTLLISGYGEQPSIGLAASLTAEEDDINPEIVEVDYLRIGEVALDESGLTELPILHDSESFCIYSEQDVERHSRALACFEVREERPTVELLGNAIDFRLSEALSSGRAVATARIGSTDTSEYLGATITEGDLPTGFGIFEANAEGVSLIRTVPESNVFSAFVEACEWAGTNLSLTAAPCPEQTESAEVLVRVEPVTVDLFSVLAGDPLVRYGELDQPANADQFIPPWQLDIFDFTQFVFELPTIEVVPEEQSTPN